MHELQTPDSARRKLEKNDFRRVQHSFISVISVAEFFPLQIV